MNKLSQQQSTDTNAAVDNRPIILDTVSTTQMDELERHYEEQDHKLWDRLAVSYGWTPDQSEQVWTWFGQRPSMGQD